jgi:hypothetical protein
VEFYCNQITLKACETEISEITNCVLHFQVWTNSSMYLKTDLVGQSSSKYIWPAATSVSANRFNKPKEHSPANHWQLTHAQFPGKLWSQTKLFQKLTWPQNFARRTSKGKVCLELCFKSALHLITNTKVTRSSLKTSSLYLKDIAISCSHLCFNNLTTSSYLEPSLFCCSCGVKT